MPHKITLVFDGGSHGNPGPAYGSFVLRGKGLPYQRVQRVDLGFGTNNEAEYRTLIAGLRALLASLEHVGIDPREVVLEVRGDSLLVLSQLRGDWKARNARMRLLRQEVGVLVDRLGAVKYVYQPRGRSVEALGH